MSQGPWIDADDRARRAQQLMGEARFAEALEQLEAALEINPLQPDWLVRSGQALEELGRHDDALTAYVRALTIDPQHCGAMTHVGISQMSAGQFKEAIKTFEHVEAADPAFEASYCNRVRCYTELGDHESAELMFYTARLYREHCPTCLYNIGRSLAARGLHDRALYCWRRTIDLAGDDVHVRGKIARTLRGRGFFEQARREYLEGLKRDPGHVETVLELVSLLIEMHRTDEAAQKLEGVRGDDTHAAAVSFAEARLAIARRKPRDAEHLLRRTLQLDPTFVGAHLKLAEIAYSADDLIRTKSHLRAELTLRPGSTGTMLDLANMLIDVDEIRLAVGCLKRLLLIDPKNVRAWQNLAVAECLRGRFGRGAAASVKALELDPGNVVVRHNLALAYLHSGDVRRAGEQLTAALKLAPHHRLLRRLRFRVAVVRTGVAVAETFTSLLRRRA
jgi:tetratricopeptide (TPR) repeat protein